MPKATTPWLEDVNGPKHEVILVKPEYSFLCLCFPKRQLSSLWLWEVMFSHLSARSRGGEVGIPVSGPWSFPRGRVTPVSGPSKDSDRGTSRPKQDQDRGTPPPDTTCHGQDMPGVWPRRRTFLLLCKLICQYIYRPHPKDGGRYCFQFVSPHLDGGGGGFPISGLGGGGGVPHLRSR